jgi:hypothetical protein
MDELMDDRQEFRAKSMRPSAHGFARATARRRASCKTVERRQHQSRFIHTVHGDRYCLTRNGVVSVLPANA